MNRLIAYGLVACAALALFAPASASAQAPAAQAAATAATTRELLVFPVASHLAGDETRSLAPVTIAESLRSAAQQAMPELSVLNRADTERLLAAKPLPGCTANCEGQAARAIGADLVLITELTSFEGQVNATLTLTDAKSLAIVGRENVSVKRARNLERNLPRLVGLLLARVGKIQPVAGDAARPAAVAAPVNAATGTGTVAAAAPVAAPPSAPERPVEPKVEARSDSKVEPRQPPVLPPLPAGLQPSAPIPAETSPDALVARDVALGSEEAGKLQPGEAEKAWRVLAATPPVNPFKDAANLRARQWADYRAARQLFDKQREDDRSNLLKILPLRSVTDGVKLDFLSRFAKLYGAADARELLPAIDKVELKAAAEGALGCEANDAQSCLVISRAAGAAGDKARQQSFLERACAAGSPEACEEFGTALADSPAPGQDLSRASAALKVACDGGRGRACSLLATIGTFGEGGTPDPALLEKGCVAGDGQSCMRLGLMTEAGTGVKADASRAEAFFRLGCKFNNAGACSKFNSYQQRADAAEAERQRVADKARQQKEADALAFDAAASARSSRRTAGVVLILAGLASGAGAAYCLYAGNSTNDDIKAGKFKTAADLQSALDTGATYNLAAIIAGGAGAAILGTGLLLFGLNGAPDTKVAVLPGSILIAGRFP